jgi:hypothetical protein
MWLRAILFFFAAAGFLLAGVVLRLAPFVAIAAMLFVLAGMAAWRGVKPYQSPG